MTSSWKRCVTLSFISSIVENYDFEPGQNWSSVVNASMTCALNVIAGEPSCVEMGQIMRHMQMLWLGMCESPGKLGDRACHPGGHHWNYHPGALSLSQVAQWTQNFVILTKFSSLSTPETQFDKLQCIQWWKFRENDSISISVQQLIWGSHTRRFYLRVPDLQISCRDLTTWQGARLITQQCPPGGIPYSLTKADISIDLSYKSHNAPAPYSTMHHSEQKCESCVSSYWYQPTEHMTQ